MPGTIAGALVMLGQIGDAICTPIVGYLTDKYSTKRKWHIFGTIVVFLTFPLIFSICPWCDVVKWWAPVYFTIIILLFQFGWPIVQITHLAMIPEISRSYKDRSDLTATRYSASVCSNVIVYIVTWGVLHGRNKKDNNIGPSDAYRFRDIALILTLIGLSMSVLFHFSLSLTGYETRRRSAIITSSSINKATARAAREAATGTATKRRDSVGSTTTVVIATETERLIQNRNENNVDDQNEVRRNFLRSPLLYQNAFL